MSRIARRVTSASARPRDIGALLGPIFRRQDWPGRRALAAVSVLSVALLLFTWVAGQGLASRVTSAQKPAAVTAEAPNVEPTAHGDPDGSSAGCDGGAACPEAGTTAAADEAASPALVSPPGIVAAETLIVAAATAAPASTLPATAAPATMAPAAATMSATAPAATVAPAVAAAGTALGGPRLAAAEAPAPSLDTRESSPPLPTAGVATPSSSVVAAAPPPSTVQAAPRVLLDERFTDNQRGWPDDQRATAWLADEGYRLSARQPGNFVAVGVPASPRLRDVEMTATYRKVGGPPGGGFGLIVRDQGDGPRDGIAQGGRYYVLEAGDRGEVGIWRRDGERWIDVLPWTPSPAVRPGDATNELTVRVFGDRLLFLVNGVEVANRIETTFGEGTVGIFVGGDGNEVLLERLRVEAAE